MNSLSIAVLSLLFCGVVLSTDVVPIPSKNCQGLEKRGNKRGSTIPVYGYEVISTYPHDPKAFTQGLLYDPAQNNIFYESTGLWAQSSLRKVDLATGLVFERVNLASNVFAEGLTLFNNTFYQLTWQNHIIYSYNKTFGPQTTYPNPADGWGLTDDGQRLIMSDGTNRIRFLHPSNLTEISSIYVTDDKGPVQMINELEYINGLIWANLWYSDYIVHIDPKTGKVISKLNTANVLQPKSGDVLNGIAYDSKKDRIFITGKLWPKMFEIKVCIQAVDRS